MATEAATLAVARGTAVVAVGGDGSLNTVAQAAHAAGCPMGVIPYGTFNYFARTHGIPTDPAAAVRLLLDAHPSPVQVAALNNRLFLVNASLGLYPELLQERETFKARFGRSRWVAFVAAGATLLRGGAYKPRTSPYAFQGLGVEALRILADVRDETGLPIVTEVLDTADVDVVAQYADMLQIGTRNMQNFGLLQAVGSVGKPVMLKRGLTATYEEWLMAAEYIAQRGNLDIVLCERGVRSFEPAIRNMLDVSAVPMMQSLSHLPIIVDPSHAAGRRDLVVPLARAGIAAGADGVMVDVHPHPEVALVDGAQALVGESLDELAAVVTTMPALVGRTSAAHLSS